MSISPSVVVGEGEREANLPGKLLEKICRLGEQCLKLGYIGHNGPSSPMGFGWGFGRDEWLGRVPGLGIKVRSNINISTMIGEGFDGGVELGHVSLELHPSGHGSKETRDAQSRVCPGDK